MTNPKHTIVEIRTVSTWSTSEWREASSFPSVRAARESLAWAIEDEIDHLSRAWYDLRFRFRDGTTRDVSIAKTDHAIERAKAMRWYNSIGQRLRRGEAVAV